MKRMILFQMIVMILVLVAACGGGGAGGSGSSTGTVNLALTDASTSDYKAIYVTVKQVDVHKEGGGGWQTISAPNKTYNLLDLVNGVREELALATLATGHYTQMRLILTDKPDNSLNILSVRHPYGNYFIDDLSQSVELKVPSGYQTGIKIVKGFDINSNETTELVLDFDATRSIVKAGSSGKWLLNPTIKMMATEDYCIISGNVKKEGILVSAQIYDASAPAEENKVQIEAATVSDKNGDYKLFVAPGTYTLVGYAEGYVPYSKGTKVVVEAGKTYTEDFSLTPVVGKGTLQGGPVGIPGADEEQYSTVSIRMDRAVDGKPEQIEVKSLHVANEGSFAVGLPVGNYEAVISTFGETAVVLSFNITADNTTNLGPVDF